MLRLLRHLTAFAEFCLWVPRAIVRWLMMTVAFNPKLGPLRHVFTAAFLYVLFAILLVYVAAPIRGYIGELSMHDRLGYDAERWLATAIYDPKGSFVGTFDPRLDSLRDVNYTDSAIALGDYVANPDHKSIPVREVPEQYWRCLSFQEDRYLGGPLNPFGIDLIGVLKIPLTTITRSIAAHRPSLGVGGSTLPMQFARVIYKTPPSPDEGGITKLRRKLGEWWLAPVIYRELTRGGDDTLLKQWAANHIWLAQRTGGQPLHGVEVTSQVVFGKEAKDLSTAEQFVLASAVNKPIILLEGNDRLNAVRLDRWRYITEVRARTCAEKLITDEAEQKKVVFELMELAGGPPDPKVKPKLEAALERFAPEQVKRAEANPTIRANLLLPAARFGIREEMKQSYGFGWRDYVRGVTTTFDIGENLAFREKIDSALAELDTKWTSRIDPAYTLDPKKVTADKALPNVIVVAADADGNIVRYYEAGETAAYFGSLPARRADNGLYDSTRESRQVASTGKMILAVALANQGRDTAESLYADPQAPAQGLDTCAKGGSNGNRKAVVAFACSLNAPLITRGAQLGQAPIKRLIDGFGFTMPPAAELGGTPPSTAVVLGQIAGAPQRVQFMSSVILASLIGRGTKPVRPPTLIAAYDYTQKGEGGAGIAAEARPAVIPKSLIRPGAVWIIRSLLEAPLCYQTGGQSYGTLKSLSQWCARRRGDLRLHFAKTGTSVSLDPNATVDAWASGGLQFANGAAYSYVVLVGTGTASKPWARDLHSAQIAAPLLDVLLRDLADHAKANPRRNLLPPRRPASTPVASLRGAQRTLASEGTIARDGSPSDAQLRTLTANER
ncbi:transglycosylase domain-containing protein [Hyphomicrobium sp.]|uniref:transglycosylase domain-containing protein n=1 Tax=Hyphomicrobium sp. TaxID=82 RepID=UPI001DD6AB33|nr:transglycosylase domain-containing protein [Hyphomicrobium sp.]MBY0562533.1 transglycosylase domain-containing protein [Hyphomicrobium sp.]